MEAAFADGLNLVEVEFPPLQQDYLEDSGSSAYDVSSANVRLAARFAQSFAADGKVRLFVYCFGLCLAWLDVILAWFGLPWFCLGLALALALGLGLNVGDAVGGRGLQTFASSCVSSCLLPLATSILL